MTILVADDDPVVTTMLSCFLKKQGYTVVIARDAMQAIMIAFRKPPDAIVLDVMMPGGTGVSVLRQLKHSVNTALIPVVVISGSVGRDGAAEVKQLGADHFMTKPPDLQELSAKLTELIQHVHGTAR